MGLLRMFREFENLKKEPAAIVKITIASLALIFVYLFQGIDVCNLIGFWPESASHRFAFNKTLRLLVNDLLMLWIIHLWFKQKETTSFALMIQIIDLIVLLPVYLFLKLSLEGPSELSSPLLSHIHRLIINPTLMILLFPAVYFQRAARQGVQTE